MQYNERRQIRSFEYQEEEHPEHLIRIFKMTLLVRQSSIDRLTTGSTYGKTARTA